MKSKRNLKLRVSAQVLMILWLVAWGLASIAEMTPTAEAVENMKSLDPIEQSETANQQERDTLSLGGIARTLSVLLLVCLCAGIVLFSAKYLLVKRMFGISYHPQAADSQGGLVLKGRINLGSDNEVIEIQSELGERLLFSLSCRRLRLEGLFDADGLFCARGAVRVGREERDECISCQEELAIL